MNDNNKQQHPQQPPIDPYQGLNDPDVKAWIERNYSKNGKQ
jgi:hypothetical protein